MILLYHKLNPSERLYIDENLNWKYLNRGERKRVRKMIEESKNNDLLVEMLRWLSTKYIYDDSRVIDCTLDFAEHVTNCVRQPRLYQAE